MAYDALLCPMLALFVCRQTRVPADGSHFFDNIFAFSPLLTSVPCGPAPPLPPLSSLSGAFYLSIVSR